MAVTSLAISSTAFSLYALYDNTNVYRITEAVCRINTSKRELQNKSFGWEETWKRRVKQEQGMKKHINNCVHLDHVEDKIK